MRNQRILFHTVFMACFSLLDHVDGYLRKTAHKDLKVGETLSLVCNLSQFYVDEKIAIEDKSTVKSVGLKFICAGCPAFVNIANASKEIEEQFEVEYSKFIISFTDKFSIHVIKDNMQTFHSGTFQCRVEFQWDADDLDALIFVMVEGPVATQQLAEYEQPLIFATALATTLVIVGYFLQSYLFNRVIITSLDLEESEFF